MTRAGDSQGLGWLSRPSAAGPLLFEFSSRGDRVSGRLHGDGATGAPLLLACNTADSLDLDALLPPLRELGVAVAEVDLPLHGARAEHKLAACVEQGWRGEGPMAALARDWRTQSRSDLARSLDALCAEAGADATRLAYLGVGRAADLGAAFCAEDGRPRAAILVGLDGGPAPPDLDAQGALDALAPRPLLRLDDASSLREKDLSGFLAEALGL